MQAFNVIPFNTLSGKGIHISGNGSGQNSLDLDLTPYIERGSIHNIRMVEMFCLYDMGLFVTDRNTMDSRFYAPNVQSMLPLESKGNLTIWARCGRTFGAFSFTVYDYVLPTFITPSATPCP